MILYLRLLAFLLIVSISTHVFGQDESESEDQLIAQAIWSLVDFGSDNAIAPTAAFREASSKYPSSAKVAYWRGKFQAFASDRVQVFNQISKTLKNLTKPQSDDGEISDPVVLQKMQSMRIYAEKIAERIEQRTRELPDVAQAEGFELSLLDAATRDPMLIAAWAGLLESNDQAVALAAADAWANQEPNNALPLYAKAIIFTRNVKQDIAIDKAAIEALEKGNKKPDCRAPDQPWPEDFTLYFPKSLPRDAEELEGELVTPQMFRKVVEGMFFQIDAIGGGDSLSDSAIRRLGNQILDDSHRLSRQEDVRFLRAFAGVGVHLVQSNRFLYGVTAGSVDRTLNRLETIAVDQGDFKSAEQLAEIRDYVIATRRRVADGYRATEAKDDPARVDLDATKIMDGQKRTIPIPQILFSDEQKTRMLLGDWTDDKTNMVVFDLFYSSDHGMFVRQNDQEFPSKDFSGKELSKRGYSTFEQNIDALRDANRKNRRSRGVFLVANDVYMGRDIADECFVSGYVGKRDPCIVAFTASEHLENFREFYPHVDVRVAQILGPGGVLQHDNMENISKKADLVAVPVGRLLQEDGQVVSLIVSTKLEFIATASHPDQLKPVEGIESIVGTASINLLTRGEQDDEP